MHLLYSIFIAPFGLMAVAGVASLLFLLLAAALGRGRSAAPESSAPTTGLAPLSLAVIVPAHDEELVLGETLASLSAQSYPRECLEIVVVADNCTDGTAALALSYGATVLERADAAHRGKGYALNHAITHLLQQPLPPDGFVIVDADTAVAPDFLACMSARLSSTTDARGFGAWQGRYGVLNVQDGWRAGLMAGAFDLVNHVKPLGREALGLSVGLKGNGMAFTRALAAALPWPGGSLTEDLDYGLELARRFSLRVRYAPEARVVAQMPVNGSQAASQRARWEEGRATLVCRCALPLLWEGFCRRSLLLLDSAWDLLVPPLAQLGALALAFLALIALGLALRLLPHPLWWAGAGVFCALGLPLYILGGLRISGAPSAAYAALVRAPFYAAWKFALLAQRAARPRSGPITEDWVRTARVPLPPSDQPAASSPGATEVHPQ